MGGGLLIAVWVTLLEGQQQFLQLVLTEIRGNGACPIDGPEIKQPSMCRHACMHKWYMYTHVDIYISIFIYIHIYIYVCVCVCV